jgi:CO/xanthine dehydrogenase Mo-binding subunit
MNPTVPDMLGAKSLCSPIPHGPITWLDVSPAEALPGVHAVLTGADTTGIRVGRQIIDMPIRSEDVLIALRAKG